MNTPANPTVVSVLIANFSTPGPGYPSLSVRRGGAPTAPTSATAVLWTFLLLLLLLPLPVVVCFQLRGLLDHVIQRECPR